MNSQLRRDLVSGDWVVVAPKRLFRPHQFQKKEQRIKAPIKGCPFERLSGDPASALLVYGAGEYKRKKNGWGVAVIKNKFPAFIHKPACAKEFKEGPYSLMEGRGYHELVLTRDHDKNFPRLSQESAWLVLRAFQHRYEVLSADRCLAYVSMFHNWGPKAGASVYHPHYQIVGIPVVPPDVEHSLSGSLNYWKRHKTCVHCAMIDFEKKHKHRIVAENSRAIAFAPFVSRQPFELRIFPQKHSAYFEKATELELKCAAEVLQKCLGDIEKRLGDPDYNFFIHTAPVLDRGKYRHYHWHIEILPKLSIWAGFELDTGIDITVVDPDQAARILKS